MKQLGRTVCPYCGKKVNFFITWGLRRRGEYSCPRCHGISNVFLTGTAIAAAFLAIASSLLLVLFFIFLLQEAVWWSVPVVLAPYVIFYLISLFCVRLKKPVFRRPAENSRAGNRAEYTGEQWNNSEPIDKEHLGDTRIL